MGVESSPQEKMMCLLDLGGPCTCIFIIDELTNAQILHPRSIQQRESVSNGIDV